LVLVLLCGALIAASFSIGYRLGQRTTTLPPASSEEPTEVQEAEVDSEDEDEEIADGDLSTIKAGFMEPCKLVSYLTMRWKHRYITRCKGSCGTHRLEDDSGQNFCTVSRRYFKVYIPPDFFVQMRVSSYSHLLPGFAPIQGLRHATLACYKALVKKNPKVSGLISPLPRQGVVTTTINIACGTLGADRVSSRASPAAFA
jgi:hypothetical protein